MHRKPLSILIRSVLFAASTSLLMAAEGPNNAEAKLRESLKGTMLQLRTAEAERATLQAAQTELEAKNKTLTENVAKLVKDGNDAKDASDKAIAVLKAKEEAQAAEIAQLKEALAKSDAAGKKMTDLANATEEARKKLVVQVIGLQRNVADQRAKNAKMFELGNEILTRYEKFGLGTAITAREPFVGITRARLETLVEEYQDKLSQQKIKP